VKGTLKSQMRQLITAALCIAALSCNKLDEKPAPGILSHAEMVTVLQEIYIAEEKVNRLALPRDSATQVFGLMEVKVYEKTGVDDSVFRVSLNYYLAHPKQLEKIYAAVLDSLQLREQKASARIPDQ